ncbi:UDP-glycosyltransferase 82A1-like [Syzygium oleosum]|uniref:UDP-glycosyltransferase 82A1-like n=1 Tax=Syzygium oleosum TaxID=219896 RepID=UPI0024BA54A9|nr:UDP-glycosyltransferase 82A1-like [Syzygium oleosum]
MKPCTRRPKAILVPYPAQGHVTPMLKLALILHSQSFDPVLVTPEFIHRSISPMDDQTMVEVITYVPIPDNSGAGDGAPRDFFLVEKAMEDGMAVHLERHVRELDVALMVVDLLASFAIGVGNRCGVPTVGFWPAMLTTYKLVAAILELVQAGYISDSGIPQKESEIHQNPSLTTQDLPWLIGPVNAQNARFKFWTRTLHRSASLRWLLVNSFPEEEDETPIQCSRDCPTIIPIGPLTSPSPLTKNPSFWEEDATCLTWLKNQERNSVIYVSFGSWVSPIGRDKVASLALSLESTRRHFLWVLGPSWHDGLPNGFLERVRSWGRVVPWASQVEVLRDGVVGCFVTHCGWNSTVEAVQFGRRMLCWPVAGDRFVNCKYIVEVWRVRVRLGGFGEREVEDGVRLVVEDGKMGVRLAELKERMMTAKASSRAVANMAGFVKDLKRMTEDDSL